MALDIDLSTGKAQAEVESLGKKIESLGPLADKAGRRVQSAFGRGAYRDMQQALYSLRREYVKILDAQMQLRNAVRGTQTATAAVAGAFNSEAAAITKATIATEALNRTMKTHVGMAQLAAKEKLIQAQVEARAAEAAAKNTVVTAAQTGAINKNTVATVSNERAQLKQLSTMVKTRSAMGVLSGSWATMTGQMRASEQSAAAFRGALYGSGLGIGVFTGKTILAGASLYALAMAIKSTITTGAKFEQTFERVLVMVNATEVQTQQLSDTILNLGANSQFMASEVAGAALELALAGLSATDVMAVLDDVTTLAAVAMFDLQQAAEIVINVMNAFQIPAEDMGHVIDVMAYAANESSINLQDFANTMKYVGPAASVAGAEIEEVAAAIVFLGNSGIKGSQAGTSLRRVFVNMARPTKMAADALAGLKVQVRDSSGELRSMIDVFEDLSDRGAKSAELIRIFGVHAFSAVSVLLRASSKEARETGKSLRTVADEMRRLDGVAIQMQEALEDNLVVAFKKLRAALEVIQIKAFSMFGEELQGKIEAFRNVLVTNSDDIAGAVAKMSSTVVGALVKVVENLDLILATLAAFVAYKAINGAFALLAGSIKYVLLTMIQFRKIGSTMAAMMSALTMSANAATLSFSNLFAVMRSLSKIIMLAGRLTAIGFAIGAFLEVMSFGSDKATDSQEELGVAVRRTTEELERMSKAKLGVAMIEAQKATDIAKASVEKYRDELKQLQKDLEAASRPQQQTTRIGRETFVTFSAPDEAKMAAIKNTMKEKTLLLAAAEEEYAEALSYANEVTNRYNISGADKLKIDEQILEQRQAASDSYDRLLDKLHEEAFTVGMSARALDEYKVKHGEVADTIFNVSNALSDEYASYQKKLSITRDAIQETQKKIEVEKAAGRSTVELEATLKSLIQSEDTYNKLLQVGIKEAIESTRADVLRMMAKARLNKIIFEAVTAYEELYASLEPVNRKLDELAEAIALVANNSAYAAQLAKQFGVSVETIGQALQSARIETATEGVAKALERMFPAMRGVYQAIIETNTKLPTLVEWETAAKVAVDALNASEEEKAKILQRIIGAYDKLAGKTKKYIMSQEELAEAAEAADAALSKQAEDLKILIGAYAKGSEFVKKQTIALEQYKTAYENLTEAQRAHVDEVVALMKQLEQVQEIQGVWDDFFSEIDQGFKDVFTGAIDSFVEFRDMLIGSFKKLIGNLIYIAARNQIVLSMQGSMSGGGFLSSVGGFLGVPGAGNAAGEAAAGGAGGMGGAVIPGGIFGGFGSGMGSFFSGGANYLGNPMIGSTSQAVGYAFGGAVAGFASGNLVNNLLGGGGSPGQTNTLSAVGGAIGAAVGGPIGALIGGAIGGLVSNMLGGAKTVTDKGVQIGVTGGTIGGRSYTDIKRDGGWFGSDDHYTQYGAIDKSLLEGLNDTFNAVKDSLTGMAEAMGLDAASFSNFSTARKQLSLKGLNDAEAAEKIEAWLQSVTMAAIQHFIDNTEGVSERLEDVVESFRGNAEEMIRAFELMTAIELSDAVDPFADSLEQYNEAQKSATTIFNENSASFEELMSEFELNIESLDELATAYAQNRQMALELSLELRKVRDEVSAMFGGTAEEIRQSLMDPEELYTYRQSSVDDLVAQLNTLVDPNEIRAVTQQINQLVQDMFNSLDETQREALGPEYLAFLDEVTQLASDRIDLALDQISDASDMIDLQIDTTLLDAAAARQMEAANALLAAANALGGGSGEGAPPGSGYGAGSGGYIGSNQAWIDGYNDMLDQRTEVGVPGGTF